MKKAFQPAGQPTESATLPLQNGGQYCPRRQQTDRLSDFTRCFATLYRGKSGYAAIQNGRYILEIDSEGMFYFRRRHY